jgi:outer membrane protein insertion porin family
MVFFQKIKSKHAGAGFTPARMICAALLLFHNNARTEASPAPAGMTALLFFILLLCTHASIHANTEIEPLERWYVSGVRFTGNTAISNIDLIRSMETRPPRTFFPKRFNLPVLDEDLERIEMLYRNRGYPFARATIEEIEHMPRRRVIITINIHEGEFIVVDTLAFFHSNVITTGELEEIVQLLPGRPLDPKMMNSDSRRIRDTLRDMGYLQVKVNSQQFINKEQGAAKIVHTIEEGPLIRAGELSISGLRRVRVRVIRREIDFDSGAVITTTCINNTLGNIYSTALFDYVKITPDTTRGDMSSDTVILPVNIDVKETPEYSFQFGVGYEEEQRTFFNGDAEYGNLWRIGHRISIMGYVSEPRQRIQLTYTWPWFLRRELWANVSVFADWRDNEFLKGNSEGAIAALRRRVRPNWIYNFWTTIERTRFERINIPPERLESRPIPTNQLFALALINDTRSGIFFPGYSRFGMIQAEIAGLTGIGNKYTRFMLDLRGYLPFNKDRCLISSAVYSAIAIPYGEDTQVPLRERFRTSESPVRPVRGYDMGDWAFISGHDIRGGGDFVLIVNIFELNYYLTSSFMVSIFSDAGFVWEDVSTPSPAGFAAGAGIRYALPIGLLRLDYGMPVEPRTNANSSGRLYLNLGLPF